MWKITEHHQTPRNQTNGEAVLSSTSIVLPREQWMFRVVLRTRFVFLLAQPLGPLRLSLPPGG